MYSQWIDLVERRGLSRMPRPAFRIVRSEEEPKEEPKSCGPCVLEVCASDLNACPDTNPFACLNGKTKSGCTVIEHIWLNPEVCHECCDLLHCPGEGQAHQKSTHPLTP
jgi:hypothetical protein